MKSGYLLLKFLKVISLLLFLVFLFYVYLNVPSEVAIHYNVSGTADYYINKQMLFYMGGIFAILFNTAFSLLNRLIYSVPAKLFSMPNRNYWLADKENQQGFHEILRDWFNSLVVLINSFLILCLYTIYSINTSDNRAVADYTWLINISLLVLVVWIIFLPARLLVKRNDLLD